MPESHKVLPFEIFEDPPYCLELPSSDISRGQKVQANPVLDLTIFTLHISALHEQLTGARKTLTNLYTFMTKIPFKDLTTTDPGHSTERQRIALNYAENVLEVTGEDIVNFGIQVAETESRLTAFKDEVNFRNIAHTSKMIIELLDIYNGVLELEKLCRLRLRYGSADAIPES